MTMKRSGQKGASFSELIRRISETSDGVAYIVMYLTPYITDFKYHPMDKCLVVDSIFGSVLNSVTCSKNHHNGGSEMLRDLSK